MAAGFEDRAEFRVEDSFRFQNGTWCNLERRYTLQYLDGYPVWKPSDVTRLTALKGFEKIEVDIFYRPIEQWDVTIDGEDTTIYLYSRILAAKSLHDGGRIATDFHIQFKDKPLLDQAVLPDALYQFKLTHLIDHFHSIHHVAGVNTCISDGDVLSIYVTY